jgi:hypothetical protein
MRFGPLAILVVFLVFPFVAAAQLFPDGFEVPFDGIDIPETEVLFVSISPQYPVPYGKATGSLSSSEIDLTNASLTVSINGKETYKGAARAFPIPLGAAGKIVTAQVTVSYQGKSYSKTVSVQPQDVTIVIEPLSSAPPLYPGKPLVPLEGGVRVIAVANLKNASGETSGDPSSYSYLWTVDDVQKINSSGIGKSSTSVSSPFQYRGRDVSVVVKNSAGNLVGGAELSFSPSEPTMRIYENDPLLGILYDHALEESYSISGAENTLFAAPFSVSTAQGSPLVQWFLNGSQAQTGNLITLRPTGSGEGSASLSVSASVGNRTATKTLPLLFGQAKESNFFGL